ncbi:MAG: hypothetical protein LBQ47_03665 [Endomicrobium sp.]|jgi:hypothetical protein|nr:hypothetical protein [Endomicrobium sp.]
MKMKVLKFAAYALAAILTGIILILFGAVSTYSVVSAAMKAIQNSGTKLVLVYDTLGDGCTLSIKKKEQEEEKKKSFFCNIYI